MLYHVHFPRRGINNLDMTKWKQPSNGITALIVPSGDSSTTFIERCRFSSVASLSDRLVSFLTYQYRYTRLEQPAQFGGQPCNFVGKEEEECTVPNRYTCDNVPLCEGFLCAHTGIMGRQSLVPGDSVILSHDASGLLECLHI